jgi:hypothetical protein
MSCKRIGSSWLHYRHDIITAAWRNATSRAGLSSTREPLYAELDPGNNEAGQARGDIYTILTPGPGSTAVDTVVTHLCNPSGLSHNAHNIQGAAAAAARKKKCNAFQRYRVQGLTFFAFALESCGYLDTQAMDYIRHIGFAAARTGAVTYGSFVASVHREISVALVKGNHGIFRAGVQWYTRARDMPVCLVILCPQLRLSESVVPPECF